MKTGSKTVARPANPTTATVSVIGPKPSHRTRPTVPIASTTPNRQVWFDGRIVPEHQARVDIFAHALHYGTGVFEGIRCYDGTQGPALFRLDEHVARFYQSAAWLHMRISYSEEELRSVCVATVRANHVTDGYVRPLAFYGAGGMGFALKDNPVHVAVAAWPWGAYMGQEGLERGIRVKTVSWQKTPSGAIPSSAKVCGNYANAVLAYQEAVRSGFDEAILLNAAGRVAEGSGENVFVVKGTTIRTPPPWEDNLPGITRDAVIRIARDQGYDVQEAPVTRADIASANEVFLTGTAAEITPVREIDWRPIGEGARGPVTRRIQDAFFAAIRGHDPRYEDWLTPVNDRREVSAMNGGI